MQENLPIFGIDKDKLSEFTTIEKDMKRGISKFPPSSYRLLIENVLETTVQDTKQSVYKSEDAQGDLENNVLFREQ